MSRIEVYLNPDVVPTGSDLAAVNAARRSFDKRSDWEYYVDKEGNFNYRLKESDARLIRMLVRGMQEGDYKSFVDNIYKAPSDIKELLWDWRNTPTHDTPFNHCFISFEVKAPIFVARQLVKTEYTIMSEFSRRYITDKLEFYKHTYREKAKDKKQGSGDTHQHSEHWEKMALMKAKEQVDLYNEMIKDGVAPEQARGVLPQDLMTAWTWSGTLGAFAKMCRERLGSDTQEEARQVAQEVYKHLQEWYPVSAKALVEGV